ncbi:MAG TPA: hypothetical protein VHN14_21455 [Kofleriaceae bacterium]|nr:hypothetical protein [Kofleriaceae bacterium]
MEDVEDAEPTGALSVFSVFGFPQAAIHASVEKAAIRAIDTNGNLSHSDPRD